MGLKGKEEGSAGKTLQNRAVHDRAVITNHFRLGEKLEAITGLGSNYKEMWWTTDIKKPTTRQGRNYESLQGMTDVANQTQDRRVKNYEAGGQVRRRTL